MLIQLDRRIHGTTRLRIVTALAGHEPGSRVPFTQVQRELGLTAGNLSSHLRKLEECGYVEESKAFESRTPVTHVWLTNAGRQAFQRYREQLRALLAATIDQRSEDDESRSCSPEWHDSHAQDLVGLVLLAQLVDRLIDAGEVDQAREFLAQMQSTARELFTDASAVAGAVTPDP